VRSRCVPDASPGSTPEGVRDLSREELIELVLQQAETIEQLPFF
jgi:hypothetical protein